MDLYEIREIRVAHTRDDLVFAPGEVALGGGTWLFSEQQPGVMSMVDLTALDWPSVTRDSNALTISATCTIETLRGLSDSPLFLQCADSLLASRKVQHIATVGGNICLALPAGPMTSLMVALDAAALIWGPGAVERRLPVTDLVTGVRQNSLAPGEVLRSLEVPLTALRARSAFRRISLSPLGRTGTLVIGRVDDSGESIFTVSGGTTRPHQFRFDELPTTQSLASHIADINDWYLDAHGTPDWRRAMSLRFADEIREQLS
jgi:CO/xanthine dehydrogenase FAD-binding subunit